MLHLLSLSLCHLCRLWLCGCLSPACRPLLLRPLACVWHVFVPLSLCLWLLLVSLGPAGLRAVFVFPAACLYCACVRANCCNFVARLRAALFLALLHDSAVTSLRSVLLASAYLFFLLACSARSLHVGMIFCFFFDADYCAGCESCLFALTCGCLVLAAYPCVSAVLLRCFVRLVSHS